MGVCGIIDKGETMTGVIYKYHSPSGKIYLGQTLLPQRKRIDKHKHEALVKKCETPFGHAIRKYGWDVIRKTYTVMETVEAGNRADLKAKLTERENYYIMLLDTFVPKGYNVKFTNQRELSEYRDRDAMYSKISKALKGKHMNEAYSSRKIKDITSGIEYPSISEAYRCTGIKVQEICRMLKGGQLTAGGHKFCYLNQDGTCDESNLREINRKQLPVYCLELDMHFVSAYDAAKYIDKPNGKGNIRLACQTGRKRYGYTWIYE